MNRESNKNTTQKDQKEQKPDKNKPMEAPSQRDTGLEPLPVKPEDAIPHGDIRRSTSVEDVIDAVEEEGR